MSGLVTLLLFAFGIVLSGRALLRRNYEALSLWSTIALISLIRVATYQSQIYNLAAFFKIVEPFNF